MAKWEMTVNEIKGCLVSKGLTYADLANHLGITRISVQNKLDGKTEFKANEIIATANLLEKSPLIFFTQNVNGIETNNTRI